MSTVSAVFQDNSKQIDEIEFLKYLNYNSKKKKFMMLH